MSTRQPTTKLEVEKALFRGAHDLSHAEFRVLVVMLTYTDKDCRDAFPSQARIGEHIGVKDRKRVSRILRRLVQLGYLVQTGEASYGPDGNLANKYDVQIPAQAVDKPVVVDVSDDAIHRGEGVMVTPGEGVVTTPGGGVNATPLTDPEPDPEPEIPFTITADAATAQTSPSRNLPDDHRAVIIDTIQEIAGTPQGSYTGLMDDLGHLLEAAMSEEAADLVLEGKWTIPPRCKSRYHAVVELNKLLHTTADLYGPEAITPRHMRRPVLQAVGGDLSASQPEPEQWDPETERRRQMDALAAYSMKIPA